MHGGLEQLGEMRAAKSAPDFIRRTPGRRQRDLREPACRPRTTWASVLADSSSRTRGRRGLELGARVTVDFHADRELDHSRFRPLAHRFVSSLLLTYYFLQCRSSPEPTRYLISEPHLTVLKRLAY